VGYGFSKWNPVTNKRDTVALGVKYFYNTASNWTEFEIPIDWTSPENILTHSTSLSLRQM
jgi:hypothetical protein